ncbi:MAG TPA: D-aminoacyl-tRNA deacylase [Ignavibacteria bacterium]|nr:D-aminoacyl-tRNA deacylase [Ignavibacteria bacterium]
MIAVIQRVRSAGVMISGKTHSSIDKGLLVLLGVHKSDKKEDSIYFARKTIDLRIFSDEEDKMNLNVKNVNGEVLVISQFTLCTDNGKSGNRPSFFSAELPEIAEILYEDYINEMKSYYSDSKIASGVFGAQMEVNLINDGPVTIILQRN